MFTANVKTKLNNANAVSFKSVMPSNSQVATYPAVNKEEVDSYVRKNWDVVGEGFADGKLPFSKFLARRIISFLDLLSPANTETILTNAKLIEKQLKDNAKNPQVTGGRLDVKAA